MDAALVAVATPGIDAAEGRVAAGKAEERGGREGHGVARDTAGRKSWEGVFHLKFRTRVCSSLPAPPGFNSSTLDAGVVFHTLLPFNPSPTSPRGNLHRECRVRILLIVT